MASCRLYIEQKWIERIPEYLYKQQKSYKLELPVEKMKGTNISQRGKK